MKKIENSTQVYSLFRDRKNAQLINIVKCLYDRFSTIAIKVYDDIVHRNK